MAQEIAGGNVPGKIEEKPFHTATTRLLIHRSKRNPTEAGCQVETVINLAGIDQVIALQSADIDAVELVGL